MNDSTLAERIARVASPEADAMRALITAARQRSDGLVLLYALNPSAEVNHAGVAADEEVYTLRRWLIDWIVQGTAPVARPEDDVLYPGQSFHEVCRAARARALVAARMALGLAT